MIIDKHFKWSLAKSILRIIGFIALFDYPVTGVSLLVIAEILGIAEEL